LTGPRTGIEETMTARTLARLVIAVALILSAGTFAAGEEDDRAICAVCGPREGSSFEIVKARATWRGTEYAFCSVQCKVEFLQNPNEFLISEAGTEAPPFSLPRLGGDAPVTLASLRGRVVLLDFWATFCAPCVAALPRLQALQSAREAEGLTVVGVLVDNKAELATKLLTKAGALYPALVGDKEVWTAYRVNALPSLVLVGRDGRIRRRFGGEADPALLESEIAKALAEPAS
jgi:thiol-disulfide isomerase/thioredoxin